MNRRDLPAWALVVAVAAVLLYRGSGPEPVEVHSGPEPGVPVLPRQLPEAGPVRASMPDSEAPLGATFPQLMEMATSGNLQAACRLAAERQRCSGLADAKHEHDAWLAERRLALETSSLTAGAEDLRAFSVVFEQELAKREQALADRQRKCAGAPETSALDLIGDWRRAALLGHPVAVRQYASGNVFRWSDILDSAPALPTFESEAEQLALALASAGDLEMTLALAAAYSPLPTRGMPLLAQAVDSNRGMSLALYRRVNLSLAGVATHASRRLRREVAAQIDLLERGAGPDELSRADSIGVELDGQWRPVDPKSIRRYSSASGNVAFPNPEECTGP